MDEEPKLGAQIIRSQGLSTPERLEREWRELHALLDLDRRRTWFVKWVALGFLIVGVVSIVGFLVLGTTVLSDYKPPPVHFFGEFVTEGLPIIGGWSLVISAATGVVWLILARVVEVRAMKVRLASIELHLRSGTTQDS